MLLATPTTSYITQMDLLYQSILAINTTREATHVFIHAKLNVPEARLEHHALITDSHSSDSSNNKQCDQGQAHIQAAHMTSRKVTAKLVRLMLLHTGSCRADTGFDAKLVVGKSIPIQYVYSKHALSRLSMPHYVCFAVMLAFA